MITLEGKKMDPSRPLQDYPTPQFRRDSFFCLNGPWEFGISDSMSDHNLYSETIIVPFAMEAPLSGIGRPLEKGRFMHYRKTFDKPEGFNKGRILLHFEAVDQVCDVYLNDVKIAHHEGGYQPFVVDLLEIKNYGNVLCVDVMDDVDSPDFPRGKQKRKRGGIWYTPTSGIYGTVWMESVPKDVIQKIKITPNFDDKTVQISAIFEGKIEQSEITISYKGTEIAKGELDLGGKCVLDLSRSFHPWSPTYPNLYDVKVKVNRDVVESYFAMRKFSVVDRNGKKVFGLNNEPLFLNGLLDQGYYPDGGLTPPSDKAMVDDINMVKSMGFNMLRKHIKIEPMRWYYHCDRLGVIVIQDMVNGGSPYKFRYVALRPFFNFSVSDHAPYKKLGRGSKKGRDTFLDETKQTVERLYNVPCIAIWTLFNEGWGQFDAEENTKLLRELDRTRLIDATSGWFDVGAGDFSSHHVYFKKIKLHNDGKRILSLSEFGGYSLKVEMHTFSNKAFGYKRILSTNELIKKIGALYDSQVCPLIESEGLSVAVLTQLSDVEDEINGLVTYDRKKMKIEPGIMARINENVRFK